MNAIKRELKPARPVTQPYLTYEQVNTITVFERLWTDIAAWTRAYIVSSVFSLPNLKAVSEKLYSLPMGFYDIFVSYYGTEHSQSFISALSDYEVECMRMVDGMCGRDQQLVDTSVKNWYLSADKLARFLSEINPYWDENQWRNLLYQYCRMKIDEVISTLNANYEQGNDLYDRMEDLTFIIGSYMARGIIAMSQYLYK